MTDNDLLTQLSAYGDQHRSEQRELGFDEIVAAGERRLSSRLNTRARRRGLMVASAAATIVALVGGVALLVGSDASAPEPGDDVTATTQATTITSEVVSSSRFVVPTDAEEPVTPGRSVATAGTPLPDIASAVAADDGAPPLPLGVVTQLPNENRLDFLFELCAAGCWRDAHFVDPEDPSVGSGPWPADRPFHVRQGFVNDGAEPLGLGFDVALYVYSLDDVEEIGETVRYTSDYVLRGETDQCGPAYKSQTEPVTCEWFVHDFPDGLPEGRWAIWAVWEAPCSAWIEYGLTSTCADPNEVLSFFSSGVDSPFGDEALHYGDEQHYGEPNMARLGEEQIEELIFGDEHSEEGLDDLPPPGPEVEIDASGSAATGGTPLPDFAGAIAGDDGAERLPLGVVTESTYADRLDFLADACRGEDPCFRDAVFVNPDDPSFESSAWEADRPFIVRHGFINEGEEPLGDEFDVVLYSYQWDDFGEMGPTLRYTSDYVLRGSADECGPTYLSLTEPVTCEWFVHEFNDGLPAGRHALWAFWQAPCWAWVDYGFVDSCSDANEVMALFASGVDSPWEPRPVVWGS